MAVFQIFSIFAQNGGHFVCYHGNGGLAEKSSIYFLLSKTHSILLAEKNLHNLHKLKYIPICLVITSSCELVNTSTLECKHYANTNRVKQSESKVNEVRKAARPCGCRPQCYQWVLVR